MSRPIRLGLFASGLLIALLGIGVDNWLPGASPGVNPPQLFFIAAGFALALYDPILRRARSTWRGVGKRSRRLLSAAIVAAVTIVILELALWMAGLRPDLSMGQPEYPLVKGDWHTCDEAGCHYVYEAALRGCESRILEGRICAVNRQGYADADDFTWDDVYEDRPRILLLGDSFTFGMIADFGRSFAELLDAEIPEAVIWNTGIPGSGTHNAIAAFNVYGRILKPHLTILGFYNNDYDDNLNPVDAWLNAIGADGKAVVMRTHIVDEWENVIAFDIEDIEYFLSFSHFPPDSELERLLRSTQLGTLLHRLSDLNEPRVPVDTRFSRREQVTRGFVQELRDAVAAQGSAFLVHLIPGKDDLGNPGKRYQLTQEIMESLEIPYLNPISILDPIADYRQPHDIHWNNAGHQKVGEVLSACVRSFISSGHFRECDLIVLP